MLDSIYDAISQYVNVVEAREKELEEKIDFLEAERDALVKRDLFLTCLEQAGVDNWEGYSYTHELFREATRKVEDDRTQA